MDQTPLHAFIAELAASDRFQAFTKALPGRARVSEPALPLVLAALHEELGRGLLIVLPEDADARDAAEGASWFLGTDGVALLPSRGVSHASGLEPPPHLVGERARALDVLAAALVAQRARRPDPRAAILAVLHQQLILRRRVPEGFGFVGDRRQRFSDIYFSHNLLCFVAEYSDCAAAEVFAVGKNA